MQTSAVRCGELEGVESERRGRDFFLLSLSTRQTRQKISELVVPRHRVINDAMFVEILGMINVTFFVKSNVGGESLLGKQ